nr:hypothetical protein [Escherichia coli]
MPPDQFIPLAESTGLIAPITQQLMSQVEHSLNSVADFYRINFILGSIFHQRIFCPRGWKIAV